jgi:FkbM family methyltransferase
MRAFLKSIIHALPFPVTRNEAYDRQTRRIIGRDVRPGDVCIDIGAYEGEILKLMIDAAPDTRHYAFEPIPGQFDRLKASFGAQANIMPFALGNSTGGTTFHFVESNPTYSGLRRRQYKGEEQVRLIPVEVRRLDDIIPDDVRIRLIKIDVEGGELDVLRGGLETLRRSHPTLIFEHGIGGSDNYGATPEQLYDLLAGELGYHIGLMKDYLADPAKAALTRDAFRHQYYAKINCYFVAWTDNGKRRTANG